jgi:pimeloyl-ACP methyl ester carboxylesterase
LIALGESAAATARFDEVMVAVAASLPVPGGAQIDRQCLANADIVEQAMGDKWAALREYSVYRAKDPGVKAAMRTMMSELGVPPIPVTDLESISAPTELVWGRNDRANRLRIAEAASTRFAWPLHVIDRAADDPPMEQPELFTAAVTAGDHQN